VAQFDMKRSEAMVSRCHVQKVEHAPKTGPPR
jgi:hypothetical protein